MQPVKKRNRLLSLDVFRGITIAAMILVNSPGNRFPYPWLEHSVWNGCTLADLVFPFFILVAGLSSVLALTNLQTKGVAAGDLVLKIVKRSVYLFAIGLMLNAFPHHMDFATLRIPGVLQRIAICYFFSSVLFLTTSLRTQIILLITLLLGYWMLMIGFGQSVGRLDLWVFSSQHLYTPTFDPEGLISTIPSLATALLGNVLGFILLSPNSKKQQLQIIITVGILLSLTGYLWGIVFPINKNIWSSSYVLWTGGIAFLIYSFCFAWIEIKQWTAWSKPFNTFGRHSMLVYVLHILLLKIQSMIVIHNASGDSVNLRVYITNLFFGHLSPANAALAYAVFYTLFWLGVLIAYDRWQQFRLQKVVNKLVNSA